MIWAGISLAFLGALNATEPPTIKNDEQAEEPADPVEPTEPVEPSPTEPAATPEVEEEKPHQSLPHQQGSLEFLPPKDRSLFTPGIDLSLIHI